MGKKRVAYKGSQAGSQDQAGKDYAQKKISGRKTDRGRFYIQSTYNNTIITATDARGDVLATLSAGMMGFRGPKRSTPFAASQVARALLTKVEPVGFKEVEVYVKGIGAGREAAIRSIAGGGVNVTFIKDVTPIPHNGPRPRKPRRV